MENVRPSEAAPEAKQEEEEDAHQSIPFQSNSLYAAWDAAMTWPPVEEAVTGSPAMTLDYCRDDHCANYMPCPVHQ